MLLMRALVLIIGLLLGVQSSRAERYLTVAQTRKICFPKADRFEEQVLRFTAAEVKAIRRASGVDVPNDGNKVLYAWNGTELVGVIFLDHVLGKHEIIDYAVAISPEGKVLQVEILEYRESYGGEVRSPKWREQFVGKTRGSKLRLNEDIYNISGATMSCRHVTDGIKRVVATFDLLCRPKLLAAHKLPEDITKTGH
jgi:Na+-translocating ferredoxin:NAD+ oxidoreductase RnfG subunit